MKRRVLRAIAVVSLLIGLCLGGVALVKGLEIAHSELSFQEIGETYILTPVDQLVIPSGSEAEKLAFKRSPEELSAMFLGRLVEFDSLKSQNPDVWGWISIPETAVDYPIMLEHSPSSQHYLWRGMDGEENSIGSIFTYPSPTPDVEDAHLLLFGHRLPDSALMFSELPKYSDRAYCDEHPFIYIYREGITQKWRVWLAKNTLSDDPVYQIPYILGSDAYQALLTSLRQQAPYEAAPAPSRNDRILVLSTCDEAFRPAEGRYLVVAVLEEERRTNGRNSTVASR